MSDQPHYRLNKLGDELYSFTSPMGRHTLRANYGRAKDACRQVKIRHQKLANGGGPVAEIFSEYFGVRTNPT